MRKNENGVTLVALIITIIIMIILVGVGIETTDIIEKAKTQEIVSNMILIQTKVKILMEKASFNGDTSTYYIGKKLNEQWNRSRIAGEALSASELEQDTYYIYDQETLQKIGLDGIIVKIDQVYIVNYANGEVIYPEGVKDFDGETVYKLSELT